MSKPVLYTFELSIWAAAAELAVRELNVDVEKKRINIATAENLSPEFLKINPNGTLPTLEADGKAYVSTAEVTSYLVKHSSVKVKPASSFIEVIHADNIDPNLPFILAGDDAELKEKASGFHAKFLQDRSDSVARYLSEATDAEKKAFYDGKLKGLNGLISIYQFKAPEEARKGFYNTRKNHWANINAFILETLPNNLPDSGFIGGDRPGEDDFHLTAWLARIAMLTGGKPDKDGIKAVEKELGQPVPTKLANYWAAWSTRPSFKEVYAGGLH